MKISHAIFALVLLGAAGSCQSTEGRPKPAQTWSAAESVAALERMAASAPSAALAAEADYRAVAEALRPIGPVTFERFTAEAGGAVAHGVTMAFGADFATGVRIDELRLYGADPATLAAEGGAVAKRIDARGVSTFGLERALGGALRDAALRAAPQHEDSLHPEEPSRSEGVTKGAGDPYANEMAAAMRDAASVTHAAASASRLVVDGLVLHAPDAAPAKAAGPLMAALRLAAVQMRAMSLDNLAISDLRYEFSAGDAAPMTMRYTVPLAGYRGVRRGDFDEMLLKGMQWSVSTAAPPAAGAPPFAVAMTGSADLYSISNVRLAKLLDYAAKEMPPPASETDLLSLGVWRSVNERATMNGAPFYSIGESFADLSRFHWVLPQSITVAGEDFAFNLGDYFKAMTAMIPAQAPDAAGSPDAAAMKAQMDATVAALERHGLSTLSGSYAASYDWAPKTGRTRFVQDADLAGLGAFDFGLDAQLPDFAKISAAADSAGAGGEFDGAAMGAAFAESALEGFSWRIADLGFLARVFAFAADMQAQEAGVPADPAAGEAMRAGIAQMARDAAAASPSAALMTAVGDFIANGGVLTIAAEPKPPLPFVEIGKPGADGTDPVTRLGLTATASPAE